MAGLFLAFIFTVMKINATFIPSLTARYRGVPNRSSQMEIITAYTKWAYHSINARLRAGGTPCEQAVELSAALAGLKPVKGTFFRGIEVPNIDAYLRELTGKTQITFPSFLSTSKREQVSDYFGTVKFVIKGKSGRDISKFAHYKTEAEVLFDKGTTFRIDDIAALKRQGVTAGVVIQLTEL